MPHPTFEGVLEQAKALTPEEQQRLISQLTAMLQIATAPKSDWHEFVRKTYGSLRDTPIERYDQGEYEEREPLE